MRPRARRSESADTSEKPRGNESCYRRRDGEQRGQREGESESDSVQDEQTKSGLNENGERERNREREREREREVYSVVCRRGWKMAGGLPRDILLSPQFAVHSSSCAEFDRTSKVFISIRKLRLTRLAIGRDIGRGAGDEDEPSAERRRSRAFSLIPRPPRRHERLSS